MRILARLIVLGLLAGCAAPSARGLDGTYRSPGVISVYGNPQLQAPLSSMSTFRISTSAVMDAEFDLQFFAGSPGGSISDCTLSGRWIEAGSDYFEPVQRVVCAVNAVGGIMSVSFENDHGLPVTGTITASGDRSVYVSLNGICHLTDGSAFSCSIDLNGTR